MENSEKKNPLFPLGESNQPTPTPKPSGHVGSSHNSLPA